MAVEPFGFIDFYQDLLNYSIVRRRASTSLSFCLYGTVFFPFFKVATGGYLLGN
jgi:hypothetical protein